MAIRFDELESERNRAEYLPGLQQMYAQSAPPRPWMRRPGSLRPIGNPPLEAEDPTPPDTFDQRFNPRAYPPVKLPRGETPYPPNPEGERFLDPTKVIAQLITPEDKIKKDAARNVINPHINDSMSDYMRVWEAERERLSDPEGLFKLSPKQLRERGLGAQSGLPYRVADASGAIPQSGKKSDEQPYPVKELPQGLQFDDEAAPQAAAKTLPAGLKFDDEAGPEVPEDPFERAAIRTRRAAGGHRPEGAATRALEGIVPAIGQEVNRFAEMAQTAIETGDLPPRQAMEMALMANPASAAYKTGLAITRAAKTPAELAQIETGVMSIPRAAEAGQAKQALGRAISAAPVGGGPLREAAQKSTQELIAAGEAAATRPTGTVVAQDVAGRRVREGLKDVEGLSPKLRAIAKGSDEDAIGAIIKMAGSKQGADAATLAQLRRFVPTASHGEVQSAIITRLGRGSTGEFDPKAWLRNYANLSDRGKNILFGRGDSSLRTHLDAIEAISRRAPSWQQFQRERSTLGSKVGAASIIGTAVGAAFAPLTVLGTVIPMAILSRSLARPATAAPIAQWSRAYERVVRTKGAPQAIATFTIATRNLNNSLGTDVDPEAILKGSQNGNPLE